ncbi:MAG: serine/threonine protein kinase, partial [Acidobacteriota bacterium]|nr:serine/threonine protein kinase [Acidobacteriota bacterium]
MPLAPGTVLGRYEIKSLLGQGGMGAVYRAADTSLGRDVALKVLDQSVAVDPERVHRFTQEARAASALNHPNIIAIHEAGESGGTHFIATELVDGRTLRELLEDGPLPIAQALDIAAQVASALAAAHVAGIVHRDIKPENIMVRPDGYAKVLDFGLAKLTDSSASGASASMDAAATMLQTTAGVIMGTVAYMSPEQARALKVDVRTDCYSLGAVLFEMLSGRQPFKGATGTDVMVAILERDAPMELLRREGLPTQLVWVIAKALEKNPDLRHQNAADLRVDLDRLKRDIATGAVYGDHTAQLDRPSAILRDVHDSDADAVRMYGLSRGTMIAAAVALVLLMAMPFLYRRTLGAEQ